MTLMSVSKRARLKVDKEGHGDQRRTARLAMTKKSWDLLLRGMEVSKGVIQRQRKPKAGATSQYTDTSELACDRGQVGSDGA